MIGEFIVKEESTNEVIIEFKKRKRRQYIVLIVAILILSYTKIEKVNHFVRGVYPVNGFVLLIAIALMGLFSFYNWRCPACNRYLGGRMLPKYCSICGVKLR